MKADQLATLLEAAIRQRKYLPGDKLPSESQLSRTHGMSVHTVREALSQLVGKKLVEKRKAFGTYVK